MKVICAGFPKTGTKSMARALRQLDLVVHDFEEQVDYNMDNFLDFFEGKKDSSELMEKFRDVDAVTDMPGCILWKIFLKHYPDAKVILMERDSSEVWFESMDKMCKYFKQVNNVWYADFIPWLSPTAEKWGRFLHHNLVRVLCRTQRISKSEDWSKECWINQYEMHNGAVRQLVPQHQLLILRTGEGWERLCEFLDKPVPDIPFPMENIGGTTSKIVDQLREFETVTRIQKEVKRSLILVGSLLTTMAAMGAFYMQPAIFSNIAF